MVAGILEERRRNIRSTEMESVYVIGDAILRIRAIRAIRVEFAVLAVIVFRSYAGTEVSGRYEPR
jgi:hypothetical protein